MKTLLTLTPTLCLLTLALGLAACADDDPSAGATAGDDQSDADTDAGPADDDAGHTDEADLDADDGSFIADDEDDADADADADAGDADADADAGDSSDAGDDDGADGGDGGPSCTPASYSFEPAVHHPEVLLVLDKSGSMMATWDHDGDASTPAIRRWTSLYSVVEHILNLWSDDIDFGALLFPAGNPANGDTVAGCLVQSTPEVPVASGNSAAILAGIPGPDAIFYGGTPASEAIYSATAHLDGLSPKSPKAIVLVTDGAPNCVDGTTGMTAFSQADHDVPVAVASAYGLGIPTYVIGVDIIDAMGTFPTINAHTAISAIAVAGGVAKSPEEPFWNATNELELADAMATISAQIECTFPLGSEPTYPELLEVSVGGNPISYVSDCSGGEGWTFTNPNGPFASITLCSSSCNGAEVAVEAICPL